MRLEQLDMCIGEKELKVIGKSSTEMKEDMEQVRIYIMLLNFHFSLSSNLIEICVVDGIRGVF